MMRQPIIVAGALQAPRVNTLQRLNMTRIREVAAPTDTPSPTFARLRSHDMVPYRQNRWATMRGNRCGIRC